MKKTPSNRLIKSYPTLGALASAILASTERFNPHSEHHMFHLGVRATIKR